MASPARAAHFPGQAPIEAYGNGGFRFAGMSHKGSILCLPTGVHGWAVEDAAGLTAGDLSQALATLTPPAFLLLGTGARPLMIGADIRQAFAAAGIGLEVMDTGAACRTYNVLLAEGRPVAAALVRVA
jgi:uncharacterized protein